MLVRLLFFFVVTASVLFSVSVRAGGDEHTGWEKAYLELEKVSRDNAGSEDRAHLISATYAKLFQSVASMDLAKVTSRDLHAMFMAAASVDFYETTDAHLSDLRRVIATLEDRHDASAGEVEKFYAALFQGRKFDEMAAFHAKHQDAGLAKPITYRGAPVGDVRHSVLKVATVGNEVSGSQADLDQGARILVVAHPLCHFTQNAMAAIESDAALEKAFELASIWVAPADRGVDLAPFQDWNKKHGSTPMTIAYAGNDWPEVRIWQTPTFIFLKDGKVTGEVIGWPKEGNSEALRREMLKLGLLQAH